MGQPTGLAVQAADDLKAEGVEVDVWNVCTPLAVDPEAVKAAAATGAIVTVEDHHVRTGLGAQVARIIAEERLAARFKALGVTDFACSGTPEELYAEMGIDAAGIARAVREIGGPAAKVSKEKPAKKKAGKKPAKKKAKRGAKKKSAKKRKRS